MVSFDWDGIEGELRKPTEVLDEVYLDCPRIETTACKIPARRLVWEGNQMSDEVVKFEYPARQI